MLTATLQDDATEAGKVMVTLARAARRQNQDSPPLRSPDERRAFFRAARGPRRQDVGGRALTVSRGAGHVRATRRPAERRPPPRRTRSSSSPSLPPSRLYLPNIFAEASISRQEWELSHHILVGSRSAPRDRFDRYRKRNRE